jgi:hypothetical protein
VSNASLLVSGSFTYFNKFVAAFNIRIASKNQEAYDTLDSNFLKTLPAQRFESFGHETHSVVEQVEGLEQDGCYWLAGQ